MKRSLWLQEIAAELDPTPALKGELEVDVAIVGGGFVGLWTALRLLELQPGCQVAILERDICGGGASGRNGGFVMSWWPKISSLAAQCGKEEALRLARASAAAIGEIGEFCTAHRIDAHFRRNGWLWTATSDAQRGAWKDVQRTCERLGEPVFQPLPDNEVARRSGSARHLEGVIEASNATVQPARLARGLRRVALEKGVRIYENTPVLDFQRGQPAQLRTPDGSVRARRVVLAHNAWAAAIPELRRIILPVTSTIVATAPIPQRLEQIGWTGGEAITDSQLMVDYYRTTHDGRIAFGKGTGMISYASRVDGRYDDNPLLNEDTERDFRRSYPQLADVPITHAWSGPIDRTYDSLPVFGHLDDAPHIVYGVGWSGNGVGPSRIGGRILASLALGLNDEWSRCGLVGRQPKRFPPEPLRYVGGLAVRSAVQRKELAEADGRQPAWLDKTLASFAPSGLEDKNL
ncbi:FAD-binding oxidoreductase [Pseudomonas sp. ZM23]|uniref:FAD-binding oxidoreductase n=1 Tax=Pseudomonas triclosanedens TaxID=2961893 RepID=A0ABY6ZVG4_9PSED|nr:FAD-binding oxidoreductase [Pseudomonas triclosanedens]MCP8466639.1 FAD-binding oxidoreductase [Pseudomonas triclosanedens]MCP8472006.1 FAD-binding oxidoreductase [Pseudomonas triclosanedens]MCP8474610.1 FAD-binding oxidoreductase [Pseudomonas triclosanedens]WAI48015.1 FAD-binding oxidoreductase [Pseudomonas triclosanedens]